MNSDLITPIISNTSSSKAEIKPYRKYQLIAIGLSIIMMYLLFHVYATNQSLIFKLKENDHLDKQYNELLASQEALLMTISNIDANLFLYQLENGHNRDIIRTFEELEMINNWIDDHQIIQNSLCYKATIDGDDNQVFIEKCGGFGPLLVLIETTDGYRFGGFTHQVFTKTYNYVYDAEAFIFSLDTKKKYDVIIPEKALSDRGLPSFGQDITLLEGFLSNTKSMSNFPKCYEGDSEIAGDLLLTGGVKHFQIKEVEAFFVFIHYDDYN